MGCSQPAALAASGTLLRAAKEQRGSTRHRSGVLWACRQADTASQPYIGDREPLDVLEAGRVGVVGGRAGKEREGDAVCVQKQGIEGG